MDKQFGITNEMVIEMAKVIAKYISSRDFEVKFITNPDSKAFPFSHTAGVANDLYNEGYRKIHENAVVLTREEYELFDSVKKGFPNDTSWLAEKYSEIGQTARNRTAEKFAEKLKALGDDGVICHLLFNEIDEICKEITESEA